MQLHYNYNHNVMWMLLIFIHPLKFDTWHYEDLKFFYKKFEILIFIVYYDH
jgi:hypothetical protein